METKIPLDADHSTMVKFDTRNSRGYQLVVARLREFEATAPIVVRARFES
jgi:hypothetical protein